MELNSINIHILLLFLIVKYLIYCIIVRSIYVLVNAVSTVEMLRILIVEAANNLYNQRLSSSLCSWETLNAIEEDNIADRNAHTNLASRGIATTRRSLDVAVELRAVVIDEFEVGTEILLDAGKVGFPTIKNSSNRASILCVGSSRTVT